MDCKERFAVIEASTKSGKTACMIIWLLEQALKCKENQSVYWVAPIFATSLIAFNRLKNQITDKNFLKANESRMTITLPHGSIIAFKGADNPDSLYGDDCYAAVIDEASRMKEESWFAIRSTLTKTRGMCKLIGNVNGRNNFFYKLAQIAKSGNEPDFFYRKITAFDAVDAGILKMEEIESARFIYPPNVFKELYMAEASEDGSNPFGDHFIQLCAMGMSEKPAVCYGIDLGKSVDFTVIIGLDEFGQVCHFQRFQMDWQPTVQAIKMLPNVPMKIDSTGVGDPIVEQIQQGRGNVVSFKFTSASKQQIMEGLALAIHQRKIIIPRSGGHKIAFDDPGQIKNELETFEYSHTRTGVLYTAPPKLHDDCVCALALAWDMHKTAVHTGSYSWV
jgi:phage FluMu gp28-like protein